MTFRRFTRRGSYRGYGGRGYTPAPIALGALAWWDPDPDYIETDVGVRDWTDRIGGFVATQPTGAKQPTFQAAGPSPSGAPSILFEASASNFLTCAASDALLDAIRSFPVTLYVWSRAVQSLTQNLFGFLGSTAGQGMFDQWYNTGMYQGVFGDGSTFRSVTVAADAYSADQDIWSYVSYVGQTNHRARVRGKAEVVDAVSHGFGNQSTTVLFGTRSIAGSQFWDGHMYGAAIFPKALTAAEHARMQSFIDDQLGI